jgi:hypothetical protein
MNCHWIRLPFLALWILLAIHPAKSQQCSACDCYHIPISTQCEGCCGIAAGKITAVTDSTVAITGKTSTNESTPVSRTFALKPETRKNATLKEGAPATVFYRREGNVAERIDLLEALQGLLIPGDGPDPPLPSGCPPFVRTLPNTLRVYLGSNAGLSTYDDVSVLNVAGTELLDLRRTTKGLAISAKTFSADGKIIAEIIDNRFYVNPNNFFRIEKPDSHSLVVYDLMGIRVLDIKYINTRSVRALGIFQLPGAPPRDHWRKSTCLWRRPNR